MTQSGIVRSNSGAIIDNQIVWHGGMNLLGKEDVWDNLMRIKNAEVAAELLEISLGKDFI